MEVKLIPHWQDKKLRCTFCYTQKSVKYMVVVPNTFSYGQYIEVPACNKCALIRKVRK